MDDLGWFLVGSKLHMARIARDTRGVACASAGASAGISLQSRHSHGQGHLQQERASCIPGPWTRKALAPSPCRGTKALTRRSNRWLRQEHRARPGKAGCRRQSQLFPRCSWVNLGRPSGPSEERRIAERSSMEREVLGADGSSAELARPEALPDGTRFGCCYLMGGSII
jgi:hypothetical protein